MKQDKKPVGKDDRLKLTKQKKFFKTADEVKKIFEGESKANPLLAKSGDVGGVHKLAGPTFLESDKVDPLKIEAAKSQVDGWGNKPGMKKKTKSFSEQRDKLAEVYSQYLDVDSSSASKKKKKRKDEL